MPIYTPPGGWFYTTGDYLYAMSAADLLIGGAPFAQWMLDVLSTLLGAQGISPQRVQQALTGSYQRNQLSWSQSVPLLAQMFTALWQPTAYVVTQEFDTINAMAGAVKRITTTRLPLVQLQAAAEADQAQQYATSYAQDVYNQVEHDLGVGLGQALASADFYAATLSKQVAAYALHVGEDVYNETERSISQVTAANQVRERLIVSWADQAVTDVADYAERAVAGVTAELRQVTDWADTQITRTRTEAAANAANAANTAIADQNRTVSTTLAPIWAGTAESLNAVGKDTATLAPSLAPQLTDIPTEVPPDLQVALQGITAGLRNVATAVDTCALPNCTEKNKLAKEAKSISGIIGLGVFLAFLYEAVEHPAGLATDTVGALDAVVSGVVDTVKAAVHL